MRVPKAGIRLLGRVHAGLYRLTGGRWFGAVGGGRILLLTTIGRRTGVPRTVPLLAVRDGDAYVVIGSQGGHDTHPAWYLNLRAEPFATVEIGREVRNVRAHELSGDDRERCWRALTSAYSGYAGYRERTTREFPVVGLDPQ